MFVELMPPELRVEVYRIIIGRTMVSKKQSHRIYRGLIFSCRQIIAEYNFEADKSSSSERAVSNNETCVQKRWNFDKPLVLDPSGYNCPMQLHVAIPEQVLRLPEKERKSKISAILPPLLTHYTRVVFSLFDLDRNPNDRPAIEWDWHTLAQLYNIICCAIEKDKERKHVNPLESRKEAMYTYVM